MKNSIFLIILSLVLTSCDSNNDKPKTELEKLPLATQTGANTAGCLVNGIAFLPKGYFPTGNLFCFYQDGNNFSLAIGERTINGASDIIKSINIGSLNQNLHNNIGVAFPLTNYGENSKYGVYNIDAQAPPSPNYYTTNSSVTGELKITYYNFNPAIISGTFWFDAINSDGQKVEVRNGRFDVHL